MNNLTPAQQQNTRDLQLMQSAVKWAIEHGYNPFSSAVTSEEKDKRIIDACNRIVTAMDRFNLIDKKAVK